MSGDHNMYQKTKSYLDDFECPRCGHCCHVEEKQMNREAMQIALDALEANLGNWAAKTKAVEVLRQALVDADDTSQERVDEKVKREHEWVGLTDEEIDALAMDEDGLPNSHIELARAIEAKLREKNT